MQAWQQHVGKQENILEMVQHIPISSMLRQVSMFREHIYGEHFMTMP
jgi:hypothetical protein